MKAFVRVAVWVVKGALLALALGAIWLWAGDRKGPRHFRVTHWTVGPDQIDGVGVYGGWAYGRVGVAWFWQRYPEGWKAERPVTNGRSYANRDGLGWSWAAGVRENSYGNWYYSKAARSWGWFEVGWVHPGDFVACRYGVFALLAVSAATWPIASVSVLAYRRVRARRSVRAGCCSRCGYDLRATPERCPECGAEGVAIASGDGRRAGEG